ncbi:DUF6493 family protein [Streptomyces sp. NPDC014894]|uniref:DUF6493 family protein n=1 Tax=Streptomyces sp. NPDC014894 TaxID=3364931 RepID=UPI003700C443
MKEILDLVSEGRVSALPALLAPLTAAERKELLARLKTVRAELRGWDWSRWRERGLTAAGLLVAGAACQTGAAAAAAWIGSRDLRVSHAPGSRPVRRPLLTVLGGRDSVWLADVVVRLSDRTTAEDDFPFIEELAGLAGCAVPASDGCVRGWVAARTPAHSAKKRLRDDPHAPAFVPRLFELPSFAARLGWYEDPENPAHWPTALAELAESGVVERSVLVDGCVSRLLRGGRPNDMGFHLSVLTRLELTPEEREARIPDWAGMAADGGSQVAAHAQGVLAGLAESGRLPDRTLAEMTGAILFRTEKKLVRAQLTLLGKVLRGRAKDPEALAELLPAVAEGFGHEDTGVQERALKLVLRHLPAVGAEVREELAAAAALLSPAHRASAAGAFGELLPAEEPEPHEETLPAPPARVRLAVAADSVAELVEEVLVLTRGSGRSSPIEYERVLAGLVRMAHREREPLKAALSEAISGAWWYDHPFEVYDGHRAAHRIGVEIVLAMLLERVYPNTVRNVLGSLGSKVSCPHDGLREITAARTWEAALRIHAGTLPFLLATPSWTTGALDAEVLVERLREYHRLGIEPGAADFSQALLRVARGEAAGPGAESVAERAAAVGTPEGDRLAAWLRGDGPALTAVLAPADAESGTGGTGSGAAAGEGADALPEAFGGAVVERRAVRLPGSALEATRRLVDGVRRKRLKVLEEFHPAFRWLGWDLENRPCHRWSCTSWDPLWSGVLPHDREGIAHWMTRNLSEYEEWHLAIAECLPALAEAESPGGPAGPALHRALAVGLGSRRASARLASVDALLVLAARGQLDPARLGRVLAHAVQHGDLKPNRLADATRTAAVTGAYATVWAILAPMLPELLRAKPLPRALGEILAVAAECAEHCAPAGDPPPGLAELAARGGSTQSAAQASRLLTALRRGAARSPGETGEI